jgi:hypothetical protein
MKETRENSSKGNNDRKGSAAGDWFTNIDPNSIMNNAQRILNTAVDVLEEEIAAGILAARKLEKKIINVDEIRGNPEELMSRIRRDTHEAVDLFLDAITVITNHIGHLSETLNKKEPAAEKKPPLATAPLVPVVKNDGFAKAGDTVEIAVSFTNDSRDAAIAIAITKTDLIDPGGNKILSRYISLLPASLVVKPLESKETIVRVKIPKTSKPGSYSGLFRDNKNPDLRTIVIIDVA